MEQGFIDILKKLVKEQGKAALTDANKCKALLADYARSEYKKESRWLEEAVKAGVAKAIDGADDLAACKKAQIREVEEELGRSSTIAADIVNTLALVLRGDTTVTVSASEEKDEDAQKSLHRRQTRHVSASAEKVDDVQALMKKADDASNREDYAEAFKYYSKAAEQGYAEAQCILGLFYAKGQDYAKAAYWYTKAAEQGNAQAQFGLGVRYSCGEGIKQDYAKAAYWYTKAAEQRHSQAIQNLDILRKQRLI